MPGLAALSVAATIGWVLWPVFPGGYPPAGRTACLSNVMQIETGTMIYTIDYDDKLPISQDGASVVGWGGRLMPYLKNEDLFRDPEDGKGTPGKRVSYAMNSNTLAMPKVTGATDPARSVMIFEVAGTPPGRGGTFAAMLRRSPAGDGGAGGLLDSTDPAVPPTATYATGALANSGLPASLVARHAGKSNFAFLDGHARAFAPGEVSAGVNAGAPTDPERAGGGTRRDLPGIARPIAEGAGRKGRAATFSFR